MVEGECLFVLLYITRPRGITLTIVRPVGPRHVYNVIYKGDKSKIVVQKKMIDSFLFVLKGTWVMGRGHTGRGAWVRPSWVGGSWVGGTWVGERGFGRHGYGAHG